MSDHTAYPLCWPHGVARHKGTREGGTFKGTLDSVRSELVDEVDRLLHGNLDRNRWFDLIISTNMPIRRDGGINCSAPAPADPGVAIYFTRNGRALCFSCDRYDSVWKNLRALHRTIEAMRAIERYGSRELMDRAFTGFESLPAPGEGTGADAWKVLGIDPLSKPEAIEKAFRSLAKKCHPDAGGSEESWHRLQSARADALAQVGN